MATVSWRTGNGTWSTPTDWSLFRQPLAGDTVDLLAGGFAYTVTLDSLGAAQDVLVAGAGTGAATLDLTGTLDLGGSLAGTGVLLLSGLLSGGTLDLTQLRATGGGTLEGVTVLGSLAPLDGVTLDAATAARTAAAASGTLALPAQATLLGGAYGDVTLLASVGAIGAGTAAAGTVTLGAHGIVDLFQDPTLYSTPQGVSATLGGASWVILGTIESNVSNQNGGELGITSINFDNLGSVDFAPLQSVQNGIFVVGFNTVHGQQVPIYGQLGWTQDYVASVVVQTENFANAGSFAVNGGTLDFSGTGTLDNSGTIWLAQAAGQTVEHDNTGVASVISTSLFTRVEIGAGIGDFSNTGSIAATSIVFDGAVSLARLGTLHGALTFLGTLDLGGGTLDASAYSSVTIGGTVENGTLQAGTGSISLAGATLLNTAVLAGGTVDRTGPITVVDPPGGHAVTLDGVATRLELSAGSSSDATVVAGNVSATDTLQLLSAGTATLRAGFSLTAAVAGSTVQIAGAAGGGASTVVLGGSIAVDAATLVVSATLDGNGFLSLADSAAVTLDALAATAAPHIAFGAGASLLVLPGSGALGVVLSGLQPGDAVDFLSVSSVSSGPPFGTAGATSSQGSLDVTGKSGDSASVGLVGATAGLIFNVVDDGSGGSLVQVAAACYLRGTRLATPGGAVAVEALRPGALLTTASGRVAPVRWVGCTSLDLTRHPTRWRAAPIRVAAGACGPGLPARDLLVSPEHCLFIDGALIPAALLANGGSIARDDSFDAVEYWHVELDRHDILLAEGMPAESYLDTGNRALFAGQSGVRSLHPDLTTLPRAGALAIWAAHGCAPLRLDVADVRARLRSRLESAGWRVGRTDHGLRLLANGAAVPWHATGDGIRATLPAGTTALRLLSPGFVPRELQHGSGDERRLGVAVRAALLAGWPLHPDAFAHGWHTAVGEAWRWTDGDATLAVPKLAHATELTLLLGAQGWHWQPPETAAPRPEATRAA